LEAFRKALGLEKKQEGVEAKGIKWPWETIIEALRDIAKELLGKTGGPTFFMGVLLVVGGIIVLSEQPL
jgi:hypothetical protein